MVEWLLQTLPASVYEPFFYAGLVGLFFLLFDCRKKKTFRGKEIFLLASFLFMFSWRLFFARVSTRYSVLLIPFFLFFSSYAWIRIRDFQPKRFQTFFSILLFSVAFLFCAGKIAVQYDPFRIHFFQSLKKCIHPEKEKIYLVCDTKDGQRLAWYAGIPDFFQIDRQGTSPQDCHRALFPLKNMNGVFYAALQDPADSRALTAVEMNLPKENWRLCGEFLKNHHKKYTVRIYRYKTVPHWEKVITNPDKDKNKISVFNGDFELPLRKIKKIRQSFPEGWIPNGVVRDDVVTSAAEKAPISGKSSFSVRAEVLEFLTEQQFPTGKDYLLRFCVRGTAKTSLLSRLYFYPPSGPGKVVDLDKFFFKDESLYECRIPFSCSDFPASYRFRIAFIVYDGRVVMDDLYLLKEKRNSVIH